jgi:hypothetical protein
MGGEESAQEVRYVKGEKSCASSLKGREPFIDLVCFVVCNLFIFTSWNGFT